MVAQVRLASRNRPATRDHLQANMLRRHHNRCQSRSCLPKPSASGTCMFLLSHFFPPTLSSYYYRESTFVNPTLSSFYYPSSRNAIPKDSAKYPSSRYAKIALQTLCSSLGNQKGPRMSTRRPGNYRDGS